MYVAVWRYRVEARSRQSFESTYGSDGRWARLFARSEAYLGTELLRAEIGTEGEGAAVYLTIDRWRDEAEWLRFKADHGAAYRVLDEQCEALTADEAQIGSFTPLA